MEPITADGIYDIPIKDYHHKPDVCIGHSISSGGLRTIELETPAHYWAHSIYNPNRFDKPSTAGLNFGNAAHSVLLEGDLPDNQYVLSPYAEFRTKEARQWRDEQIEKGLIIYQAEHLTIIHEMAKQLRQHPLIREGLFRGEIEKSIVWQDKETGVWLKARPDVIPVDDVSADYKTTADASPRGISRSIADYGYYMQQALIAEGLEVVRDQKLNSFAQVFQEKTPPFAVSIIEIDIDYIAWGRVRNRRAIRKFADNMQATLAAAAFGDEHFWPGYADSGLPIKAPSWLSDRLTEQQDSGDLPTFADVGLTAHQQF